MYCSCMATKTITLELDAYEKLRVAKRGGESFSSVVRRVVIPGRSRSGAEVISYMRSEGPFFGEEELDAMERAADSDQAPGNPWEEARK
jgi:predicted CopG family antitoxin